MENKVFLGSVTISSVKLCQPKPKTYLTKNWEFQNPLKELNFCWDKKFPKL